MKQRNITFLLSILLSMVGLDVLAHDIEVKNSDGVTIYYKYYYEYQNNRTELAVSYRGNKYSDYSNEYSGNVVIPESVTYNGAIYPVTSIGSSAFDGCSGLTSITIPNSVTSIGSNAFFGCSGLTSITIPNSVTSIGYSAFYGCSSLTSVIIPSSVTSISSLAFSNCSGLRNLSVELENNNYYSPNNCNAIIELSSNTLVVGCKNTIIPNSVTTIGYDAFNGCSGLTNVTIPNSVTKICGGAFYGCTGLTTVTIPNSVTDIGGRAFQNCSSLTNINLPNSIVNIGTEAFKKCSCLTDITIPNSVTTIDYEAFASCERLTNVTFHCKKIKTWFSEQKNITNIVIGDEVEEIGSYAFSECTNLNNVKIGNSVTNIGEMAFYNCSGITSLTIGKSVTDVGSSAFKHCSGLKSVTYYCKEIRRWFPGSSITNVVIGDGVEVIGNNAFDDCSCLSSIIIPNSVTTICDLAFLGCSGLTNLSIGSSVKNVGSNVFLGCTALKSIEFHCREIGGWFNPSSPFLVTTLENVTNVVISDEVKAIGDYAFVGFSGLKEIKIPESVTSIGVGAFAYCSGLLSIDVAAGNKAYDSRNNCNAIIETATNMIVAGCKNTVIPESVTGIGCYAFCGCSGLSIVKIPNSVTSIGDFAFRDCIGLKTITIPNSVTTIGHYAFEYCSGLTNIIMPSTVTSLRSPMFHGCSNITSLELHWEKIGRVMELFGEKPTLKEIIIGDEVEEISSSALSDCSNLISIKVASGNKIFDSRENCNAIIETATNKMVAGCQNTFIPNSVTGIGRNAFYNCSSLVSITIPNSITSIGSQAFANCSNLKNITFPNSVINIWDNAFDKTAWYDDQPEGLVYAGKIAYKYKGEVQEITSIDIKEGTLALSDDLFKGCSGLKSVTIPNSVTSIGDNVFSGCSSLMSITIPNSVTRIGKSAFSGCNRLANITLGYSLTSIGFGAFYECNSLVSVIFHCKEIGSWFSSKSSIKNVVIGDEVTSIGSSAFRDCSGLTSITISNSVTAIGSSAFENCTCLKSITIPSSVNSIGGDVFSGCRDLSSIDVASENKVFDSRNNCNAIIYTATNTLVVGCKNTVIPNSVIKIGQYAFYGCSGLTSVTIPNSVTTIGLCAFQGCSDLECLIIGNSVTIIDDFYFCPPGVFFGCSLTSIIVDSGNKKYDSRNNCNAIIETATNTLVVGCKNTVIPNSVTSIGEHAFDSCSELTNITIPNSVTSIGPGAFINCSSLTSVTIPNSVTTIGSRAFQDCTSLSTITIPDGVTSIGDYAFDNTAWETEWLNSQSDGVVYLGKVAYTYKGEMPSNTEIILDAETKGIAGNAFGNQRNLTSITIPSGVTSIGYYAFEGCLALNKVTCRATMPPIIRYNVFMDIELSNCKLFVSKGCVDAYKAADYWKDFGMIQEEDESTPVQPIINRCDNGTYYNLNGQRVTKPTKGLYIVDGKKVVKR